MILGGTLETQTCFPSSTSMRFSKLREPKLTMFVPPSPHILNICISFVTCDKVFFSSRSIFSFRCVSLFFGCFKLCSLRHARKFSWIYPWRNVYLLKFTGSSLPVLPNSHSVESITLISSYTISRTRLGMMLGTGLGMVFIGLFWEFDTELARFRTGSLGFRAQGSGRLVSQQLKQFCGGCSVLVSFIGHATSSTMDIQGPWKLRQRCRQSVSWCDFRWLEFLRGRVYGDSLKQ